MKQNKYDDVNFFAAYERMPRSLKGLEGAGEWPVLKSLLPDFNISMYLIWGVDLDGIAGMSANSMQHL
ncbi:hypothetical protein GCM10009001_34600 [Virgibacillus siamensis]|uniref:Uncharacterized protein n=1 Tax=Virgibacillus siamensis TaxID=480071 RepID=A0ABN1GM51_9BACI